MLLSILLTTDQRNVAYLHSSVLPISRQNTDRKMHEKTFPMSMLSCESQTVLNSVLLRSR